MRPISRASGGEAGMGASGCSLMEIRPMAGPFTNHTFPSELTARSPTGSGLSPAPNQLNAPVGVMRPIAHSGLLGPSVELENHRLPSGLWV